MDNSKLFEFRNKIDEIDDKLLKLMAERTDMVAEIGKLKHDSGHSNNFIRSGREAQKIREVVKKGAGKYPPEALYAMWRGIISNSLNLENGLKIAIPKIPDFEFYKIVLNYFGTTIPYKEYQYEEEILDVIDNHTVGIFTLTNGWWLNLAEEKYKHLKVFARLSKNVFAVAKLETEESGNDRTVAISHHGKVLATHGKVKLVELEGFQTQVDDAVIIGHYGV